RAVGEHPEAAESVGIRVAAVRYAAVALSGILAALGGVYLALDQHQFTDQMTAGRGFIAVAAVIFGRWDPVRAALACLLFAAAETLQIQLQGNHVIASQFIEMIPYLLTIIALAGVVGRAVPPAALGKTEQ
ncbi:MAG TPA: ABC transporter permease, partial [Anaerolineales bacterium]